MNKTYKWFSFALNCYGITELSYGGIATGNGMLAAMTTVSI